MRLLFTRTRSRRRIAAIGGTAVLAVLAITAAATAASITHASARQPALRTWSPNSSVGGGLARADAPGAPGQAEAPGGAAPAPAVAGQLVPPPGQPPRQACAAAAAAQATCLAVVASYRGVPGSGAAAGSAPAGPQPYLASDLQAAYQLPSSRAGAGQTIAIVDAYDDPGAAADLAAYRAANHLPACTSGSGCFRKVAQDGSRNYPSPDPGGGWEVEESLDLDMASAICPRCHLVLVEATDNGMANLGLAVDEAARLGARVVSNSFGSGEYSTERADAGHWNHPGVVITASSGDGGFGVLVPAAYPGVVGVGGTTLYRDSSPRRWAEHAWAYAGSGCSAYMPKPAWQHDADCGTRTVADVAAVADPDTPVWVYDTYQTVTQWLAVGGTSAAAPIIAGVYALAGNAATVPAGRYLAARHGQLFDIAGGANGYCGGGYLCAARPGYDGPTGWGTPHGTGAF